MGLNMPTLTTLMTTIFPTGVQELELATNAHLINHGRRLERRGEDPVVVPCNDGAPHYQ